MSSVLVLTFVVFGRAFQCGSEPLDDVKSNFDNSSFIILKLASFSRFIMFAQRVTGETGSDIEGAFAFKHDSMGSRDSATTFKLDHE